jgi:hypothetical protein
MRRPFVPAERAAGKISGRHSVLKEAATAKRNVSS